MTKKADRVAEKAVAMLLKQLGAGRRANIGRVKKIQGNA
jgi:hypothetical protein